MTTPDAKELPVVVIGGGPIGLAAAAHLLERGETPMVFEVGANVGASIRSWGHVRLFSPWKYLVDPAATRLLEAGGWSVPDPDRAPTGGELVTRYLEPLAAVRSIRQSLRLNTEVVGVSRRGLDRMKDEGRASAPFVVRARTAQGLEDEVLARAVIDASGTYRTPSPLGANGLPALGERPVAERIFYGIPDVPGRDHARYAGKQVLVVGSGHSAFNALLDLARLAKEAPGTTVTWVLRRTREGLLFGGGEKDALPARGALGSGVRALAEQGAVQKVSLRIARVEQTANGLVVIDEDGTRLPPVDEIIVATGFRPNLDLTRELRLDLDPALEAPRALAPLIDLNVHSCGTVYPHGAEELKHPEPDFYTVGMKSYGRAPTFLLLTGYEQVRSVAAAIHGDWESARRVELVLPATGVCSTDLGNDGGCCGPEASREPIQVGAPACDDGCGPPSRSRSPLELLVLDAGAAAGCCEPVPAVGRG